MPVYRFIRRDPWLVLGAALATVAASVLFSIAWLQTWGVVRVYAVVHTHANGAVEGARRLGVGSPSTSLTAAYSDARWILPIGLTIWVLRLALRTSGYRIGGWRALGLLLPPVVVGVVGGALHETADAVVRNRFQKRMHRLITTWIVAATLAILVEIFATPGWSSEPGRGPFVSGRLESMFGGAVVATACVLAIVLAAALTISWQRLVSETSGHLQRQPA